MRLSNKAAFKYQPKRLLPRKSWFEDRIPRILIAAGILVILAAGAIEGYSLIDDHLAGLRAQNLLNQIRTEPPVTPPVISPSVTHVSVLPSESEPTVSNSVTNPEPPLTTQESIYTSGTQAPNELIEPKPQYQTIGVLTIPVLKLELPVISNYTDSNLKISVCRYEGEVLENPERLVIAGHNYKSHFGKLPTLTLGDELSFQGNDGSIYYYTVTEITVISMYDNEALEQGEWDITLFTCDSDRSKRVLVRCTETLGLI